MSAREDDPKLRVQGQGEEWSLVGEGIEGFRLVNDFLSYLADRNYCEATIRAYAFDVLHFVRWLVREEIALEGVTTDALLRYLAACRTELLPHQIAENVYSISDGRNVGYAPRTMNRRLAALSSLFVFREMRDPVAVNPVPRGREVRRMWRVKRNGLLGHLARPAPRSLLRLREPRRLPRSLDRGEVEALLGSLLSIRDRAIAGLMLFSGLRSCEVLGLSVRDIDISRGWVKVVGKGRKERRVPVDREVANLVQTYLLAERPETDCNALFVVRKGPHRGQPLTAAGLRTVFRYHRERAAVPAGHPHALRHTFGTALAEAGVDLAVLAALLGHEHVDSSAIYIHMAPQHVRRAYDDAVARQRG